MRLFLLTLTLMLSMPAAAAGEVREYLLANGLKLLVKTDHRAPVVVSQIWYRVGSADEHDGITGISHMLEHMMFKGTASVPAGEFSRRIAAEGGRQNAFTGKDYTAYYQRLERSRLPLAFELEADRMTKLRLAAKHLEPERRVVMEERRLRTEDRPTRQLYEQFAATAFHASGYRHPVIGWMQDIERYRLTDLESWYRRHYGPGNATVVVAGDVDPDEVHALAVRHFGTLPATAPAERRPLTDSPQYGPRRLIVKRPARVSHLVMGFKAPSLLSARQDQDAYALHVLAELLGGDGSARLQRRLVRGAGLAASVSVRYELETRGTTLLTIAATPAPGRTVAELEQAISTELELLADEPVSPGELARVTTRTVAEHVYQQDSAFYQAMRLGMLETVGLGWRRAEEHVDRVRSVTPEQVRAAARNYLIAERLTVGVLEPVRTPPR